MANKIVGGLVIGLLLAVSMGGLIGKMAGDRWMAPVAAAGILFGPGILITAFFAMKDKRAQIAMGVMAVLWVAGALGMVRSDAEIAAERRAEQARQARELQASQQKAAEDADKMAKAREACLLDLQCTMKEMNVEASVQCPRNIARLAKFDHKWTDSTFDLKFTHGRWKQKGKVITMIGDKLQMQNGFGAWQNMVYECDMDIIGKQALEVRVQAGRL